MIFTMKILKNAQHPRLLAETYMWNSSLIPQDTHLYQVSLYLTIFISSSNLLCFEVLYRWTTHQKLTHEANRIFLNAPPKPWNNTYNISEQLWKYRPHTSNLLLLKDRYPKGNIIYLGSIIATTKLKINK